MEEHRQRLDKQDQASPERTQSFRVSEDDLDPALDAALRRYASVEPRPGLEDRVLASLRSQHVRAAEHAWWRWGLAAALAAVVVVLALAWRPEKPAPLAQTPVTHQTPLEAPPPAAEATAYNGVPHASPRRRTERHATSTIEPAEANPRLEIFPSPQPLSEQEQLLAAYVAQFPERAALVAEARMQELQEDAKERAAIVNGERD